MPNKRNTSIASNPLENSLNPSPIEEHPLVNAEKVQNEISNLGKEVLQKTNPKPTSKDSNKLSYAKIGNWYFDKQWVSSIEESLFQQLLAYLKLNPNITHLVKTFFNNDVTDSRVIACHQHLINLISVKAERILNGTIWRVIVVAINNLIQDREIRDLFIQSQEARQNQLDTNPNEKLPDIFLPINTSTSKAKYPKQKGKYILTVSQGTLFLDESVRVVSISGLDKVVSDADFERVIEQLRQYLRKTAKQATVKQQIKDVELGFSSSDYQDSETELYPRDDKPLETQKDQKASSEAEKGTVDERLEDPSKALPPPEAKNETLPVSPLVEQVEKKLTSDKDNQYFYDFVKQHWEQYNQEALRMMEIESRIYEENFALIGKFLMVAITAIKAFIYKHFRENFDIIEKVGNLANTASTPFVQGFLSPPTMPASEEPQKEQERIKSPLDIVKENIKLLSLSELNNLEVEIERIKQKVNKTVKNLEIKEISEEQKTEIRDKYLKIKYQQLEALKSINSNQLLYLEVKDQKKKILSELLSIEKELVDDAKALCGIGENNSYFYIGVSNGKDCYLRLKYLVNRKYKELSFGRIGDVSSLSELLLMQSTKQLVAV